MNYCLSSLALLLSLPVWACEMESLPQTTPPPASTASSPAKVSFSLDGKMLRAHFEVESSDIFGKPTLSQNQYPYMFDVAEIFVSAEGGMPYYEFELTPFNQTFEVRIYYRHPPDQKLAFQDGVNVGIEHKAVRTAGGWMADFGVPLERLGWRGDVSKITGNAFVILGKAPNRHFFSRSLPEQDKANFHHPEFFKSLLSCGNSSAK